MAREKKALCQQLGWDSYESRSIAKFRGVLVFGLKNYIFRHAKKTFVPVCCLLCI